MIRNKLSNFGVNFETFQKETKKTHENRRKTRIESIN